MNTKVARLFSKPLMKQNIKSNIVLIIVITLIMVMMSTVMNFAMSKMAGDTEKVDVTEYQTEFYTYLGAIANYNAMTGSELSYADFTAAEYKTAYENMFTMMNAQSDMDLSVEGFESAIDGLSQGSVSIDTYIKQFEYNYALMQEKGCFTGNDLTLADMMDTMFEIMGVDSERMETMSSMDPTAMLNQMYYTVMALLPIMILFVFLSNSLIVDQVDKGSMAYVLSTPTKRSAVTGTQTLFMVIVPFIVLSIVCASRIASTKLFFGEVNVAGMLALFGGMYILVEAMAAICYMGSCIFNRSRASLAFGGGISVWFFIASLLGMFGTDIMVDMGVGVKELGNLNKMTLVGLYDIDALATVGTNAVDYGFVWKLIVLAVIAIACYTIGSLKFQKKDLPL